MTLLTENTRSSTVSKQTVYNKLQDLGYSKEAIAGIMANIDVETGGTFDPAQKQQLNNGGIGKGRGLFQIEVGNALYNGYADFLAKNNKTNSAESQLEFMHETVYGDYQDIIGRGNAKKLRNTFESGDSKKATLDFMNIWERPSKPHTERRVKAANNYLNFTPKDNIEEAIEDTKAAKYTVKKGDSIFRISKQLGIPAEIITSINNIQNPNDLKAGQQLKLPNLQQVVEGNNL